MVRMDVDDYMNQQESIEGKLPTHCLHCGVKLENDEEYICDKCFDKEFEKEKKAMEEIREEEWNEWADWNENWRFTDNRGRSVFRRE